MSQRRSCALSAPRPELRQALSAPAREMQECSVFQVFGGTNQDTPTTSDAICISAPPGKLKKKKNGREKSTWKPRAPIPSVTARRGRGAACLQPGRSSGSGGGAALCCHLAGTAAAAVRGDGCAARGSLLSLLGVAEVQFKK